MLPTTPEGQTGAPFSPRGIGAGGRPSSARARRAQPRAVANARRRPSTARATTSSSSGKSMESVGSSNASAEATAAGRISSITASGERYRASAGASFRKRDPGGARPDRRHAMMPMIVRIAVSRTNADGKSTLWRKGWSCVPRPIWST